MRTLSNDAARLLAVLMGAEGALTGEQVVERLANVERPTAAQLAALGPLARELREAGHDVRRELHVRPAAYRGAAAASTTVYSYHGALPGRRPGRAA